MTYLDEAINMRPVPGTGGLNDIWGNKSYQTYMASTQIQRRMADLKQAGLNPILAMGNIGGASTGGASGGGGDNTGLITAILAGITKIVSTLA